MWTGSGCFHHNLIPNDLNPVRWQRDVESDPTRYEIRCPAPKCVATISGSPLKAKSWLSSARPQPYTLLIQPWTGGATWAFGVMLACKWHLQESHQGTHIVEFTLPKNSVMWFPQRLLSMGVGLQTGIFVMEQQLWVKKSPYSSWQERLIAKQWESTWHDTALASYRDLQSVTIMAACIWSKASGGFLHWKPGIINVSQSKRHHPILSTPRDMEKASADNVDLTTLEISWMTLKLDWLVVSCFYVMKLLLRIPWCFEKMRAVWDLQRKHRWKPHE